MPYYHRFAPTGTDKIQKRPGKVIKLKEFIFTGDATGTITITDGTLSYVIDVTVGIYPLCKELVFQQGEDVTLTCAGSNISVFCEVNYD